MKASSADEVLLVGGAGAPWARNFPRETFGTPHGINWERIYQVPGNAESGRISEK
jgi:hypothetical protein